MTRLEAFIKKNGLPLLLLLIVLLGFSLRFWHLSEYLYFNLDEERDLFIIRKILIDHHPTLIGGSVPGGIYLGPGYFYITSIFAFISHMNPVGLGAVAATLGTLSVVLIFIVGKKLFGVKTGLLSALFYSTSFLVVVYNKIYWPLVYAPIVTLLTYFCLTKIIIDKKISWMLVLSAVLIIGIQSDPATFSLILLSLIAFLIYKVPLKNKYFFGAVALFIFSHLPLVIFDLRHDFLNTRAFLNFFSGSRQNSNGLDFQKAVKGVPMLFQNFSRIILTGQPHEVSQQISPCPAYVNLRKSNILTPALLLSVTTIIFFLFRFFTKSSFGIKIVTIHLFIVIGGVALYNLFFPGYTYEWFFYVFFPSFILILAYFFTESAKYIPKVLIALLVFIIVALNIESVVHGTNDFGFKNKSKAIRWATEQTKNKPFSLNSLGACFAWSGYRYLFWFYGSQPTKSYMDYLYGGWLYPQDWIAKEHPDTVVVFVDRDFFPPGDSINEKYELSKKLYMEYKKHLITSRLFGRTEVLVVDNKDKWVSF